MSPLTLDSASVHGNLLSTGLWACDERWGSHHGGDECARVDSKYQNCTSNVTRTKQLVLNIHSGNLVWQCSAYHLLVCASAL